MKLTATQLLLEADAMRRCNRIGDVVVRERERRSAQTYAGVVTSPRGEVALPQGGHLRFKSITTGNLVGTTPVVRVDRFGRVLLDARPA